MKRLVRNLTRTAGETDEMKSKERKRGTFTLSSCSGGSGVCVCVCVGWGGGAMTLIHSSRRNTLPKVSGTGVVKPQPHIREATWLFWKVCVHIWQAEWLYFLLCFASRLQSTNKNDHRQSHSIKGRSFNCWQPSCWWWARASGGVIQGYIRLQGQTSYSCIGSGKIHSTLRTFGKQVQLILIYVENKTTKQWIVCI